MSGILLAIAIVAGIGLVAGTGLGVAAIVMHVPTDERVRRLTQALPGANCGACGFSGCEGYAGAIASGAAATNLCIPGGGGTARVLAEIMGTQAQAVIPLRALVCCNGTHANCKLSYEYRGEQSCAAASLLYSGQKQCNYGCLGFGDCAAACPQGAITVRNGVALVDERVCVGCALCVAVCPKKIITMVEQQGKAVNLCCSQTPGALCRKQCSASCIGCKICEKQCPHGAVKVEHNVAKVEAALCTGCGLCAAKCPTKSLRMR
jgi:Na+-translocating ferredoxin:NAD+ oxidoreductase RNF subunit RnfB